MIRLAVADDHQSIIDGIKLLLRSEKEIDFVGTANNGKDLIELIEHKEPHIVITDIRMPNVDGIQLTKKIKEIYPHTKVIAFSMLEQDNVVKEMLDAGASGYLLKNSSLDQVLAAIKAVYKGDTYFDPQIDWDNASSSAKQSTLLTKRQLEILKLIGQGKTTTEIAAELAIGKHTVSTHRKNMSRALGLKGKGELLRYAVERKYDF